MTAEPLDAGPALLRAAAAVSEIYDEVSGEHGVSTQQARLLWVLARSPRNMLGLGSVLRLGKSTMTGIVTRMEESGLVERRPDPADRRHLIVTPTPAGIELAERIEQSLRGRITSLLAGLRPAESQRLGALLSRVIESAEELHRPE